MYAIRGPNVSSEVAALCVLHAMSADTCPLYPMLLHGARGVPEYQHLFDKYCAAFTSAPPRGRSPLDVVAAFGDLEAPGISPDHLKVPLGSRATHAELDADGSGGGVFDPLAFQLHLTHADMQRVLKDVVARFNLNDDQVPTLPHSLLIAAALFTPIQRPVCVPGNCCFQAAALVSRL